MELFLGALLCMLLTVQGSSWGVGWDGTLGSPWDVWGHEAAPGMCGHAEHPVGCVGTSVSPQGARGHWAAQVLAWVARVALSLCSMWEWELGGPCQAQGSYGVLPAPQHLRNVPLQWCHLGVKGRGLMSVSH